jgi:hypothetical protein
MENEKQRIEDACKFLMEQKAGQQAVREGLSFVKGVNAFREKEKNGLIYNDELGGTTNVVGFAHADKESNERTLHLFECNKKFQIAHDNFLHYEEEKGLQKWYLEEWDYYIKNFEKDMTENEKKAVYEVRNARCELEKASGGYMRALQREKNCSVKQLEEAKKRSEFSRGNMDKYKAKFDEAFEVFLALNLKSS